MKKRILGMLLCVCLVCALLPATAWAAAGDHADKVKVAGTELTTTGYYNVSNLGKRLEDAPESPGPKGYVHWESTTGTLTLYGATIDGGNSSSGIYANENYTILLSENTVSNVTSGCTNAVTSDGSVTIKGSGTLNATGATNGINVRYSVTITDSANITVAGNNGYGIVHYPTIFSDDADPVRIDSTVTANITGKTYGIGNTSGYGASPIINSPNVTITGETAAFSDFPHGAPTLGTGISAQASNDVSGNTPETYNSTNFQSYKWFKSEVLTSTPVTGVTVTPASLDLTEGDSNMLTAAVAPDNATNKTVTWTSSNPAVATVDANGKITAVAAGTATIIATTEDGGKTATCTVTVSHDYTAQTKKAEALKTAGNCRDYAVYYYSCSDCGKVENNDSHTFNGDKVPDTHVGGSHVEGASEPDHKTQTAGSTGATICDGCNATLTPAQAIQPDAHTPANVWSNDETNHWHICSAAGCGAVIDSSKAAHTSDRAAATETDPVKCSVCGYEIEPALGHTHVYGTEWKSDKDNHWNECACGDKANLAAHADANTDGKCDVCTYNIGLPTTPSNPTTPNNPTTPSDPTTPTDPTTPDDSSISTDDTKSPQTGDNSINLAVLAWTFGSFAAVCAILFCMRKKKYAANK